MPLYFSSLEGLC